jgi:hypothetical protein
MSKSTRVYCQPQLADELILVVQSRGFGENILDRVVSSCLGTR